MIEFLKEYGGLKIKAINDNQSDFPEEYRSSNINEFIIEPSQARYDNSDEDGDFFYYSRLLNKDLYCLGYFIHDGYYIGCDDEGKTYMLGDYCFLRGESLEEGIENLLTDNWDTSKQFDEDRKTWN